MSEAEFELVCGKFKELAIAFQVLEHVEVRTSEDAARVRGSKPRNGVKALLVKAKRKDKEFFVLVDIRADKLLDWKKLRKALQVNEVRFAPLEEVPLQTGCEAGGVPPFGFLKKMAIIVDPSVFDEKIVEFNAGLKTKSVRLSSKDLRKVFDSIGVAYFNVVE